MRRFVRTAPLLLLVLYSITLIWMLVDWREGFGLLPWWGIFLQLSFGFGLIAWMAWLYGYLRRR
jgi:hypothetical protein